MNTKRGRPRAATKTIHDHHPYNSIEEQLEVEVVSFGAMRKIHYPRPLIKWRNAAEQAYQHAQSGGQLAAFFDFSAPLPRAVGQVEHHINLGIDISRNRGQITYCFAIGHQPDDRRVLLRKVHFDIETDGSCEPKPMSHLQIDGGFPPGLTQLGYRAEDYETSTTAIEKPRIPCHPTTFALLAHWALLEYQSTEPDIEAFVKSSDWMSCVLTAERAVLGKYFRHFHENLETWQQAGKSCLTGCYR